MVLNRSLPCCFFMPVHQIHVRITYNVVPKVINRPFLNDLPVKNIVKIIFRFRKAIPLFSFYQPYFSRFSMLILACLGCFMPIIHCFMMQKAAF